MKVLQRSYQNIAVRFILFCLIVLIPSVRFFFKTDLVLLIPIYMVLATGIYFYFHRIQTLKVSDRRWWVAFIILVMLATYFVYPIVSLRKNPGSTGDDAIILAAQSFFSSGKLYDVEISAREPISPGPAWIMLNSPFVLLNLYWLFGASYVALAVCLIRKAQDAVFTNMFLILLGLSMVFAELLFNGHDLLPLSMALFAAHLLIKLYLRKDVNLLFLILISIFLGIISTSRIIFGILPVMYFLLLKNHHIKNAYFLFGISTAVYLMTNIYFFIINDNFQPAHLIYKGFSLLGLPFILVSSLIGIWSIFYLSSKVTRKITWDWIVLMVLSCVLLPVAYADLPGSGFDIRYWEGANYLVIPLPFLIYNLLNDKLTGIYASS